VPEIRPGAAEDRSAYLLVAAALVVLQAIGLIGLAVTELASLSGDRLALGLTTAVFFGALAGALALCAHGLAKANSWARSPVVVAELLQLLTAWSFRGGGTTLVALGLAVYALLVLVCVLHPASTRVLAASPS
jgi:hypothetical protein